MRQYLKLAPRADDAEKTRAILADVERRAGSPDPPESAGATFRVNSELALVAFRITPNRQMPISDLRPDDIEIREDGVPQKIAVFEGGRLNPRTVPVEMTLLFDCSSSV